MIEVVVLSGKGGAGKTTVTSCLSVLLTEKVICDCDVEGANLHLVLPGQVVKSKSVSLGKFAVIDPELCNNCGRCQSYCRFNAIIKDSKTCSVLPEKCEGCKVCSLVCPTQAIHMQENPTGEIIHKNTTYGELFYAELLPGKGNSGRLVSELKKIARNRSQELGMPILLIDGPPGIGCPTISSLTGAQIAILVVEPSISGIEDACRLWKLAKQFGIEVLGIINKYGISSESDQKAKKFLSDNSIPLLGTIAFKKEIAECNLKGVVPLEYFPREIYKNLLYHIKYGKR